LYDSALFQVTDTIETHVGLAKEYGRLGGLNRFSAQAWLLN